MTKEELKQQVLAWVPASEIVEGKEALTVTVPQNKLYSLAKNLKENELTQFDFLHCLSGVDWTDSLGVVYHIRSSKFDHSIVLKTSTLNKENPSLDTVCDLWKTADFLEREVYDLLGIKFKNHPDMRRIFLDESWIGYPLRKDYVDEINIIER
jgi:NADH-quinone oxidoreductase subunit C